jgi:hypothetical protein
MTGKEERLQQLARGGRGEEEWPLQWLAFHGIAGGAVAQCPHGSIVGVGGGGGHAEGLVGVAAGRWWQEGTTEGAVCHSLIGAAAALLGCEGDGRHGLVVCYCQGRRAAASSWKREVTVDMLLGGEM